MKPKWLFLLPVILLSSWLILHESGRHPFKIPGLSKPAREWLPPPLDVIFRYFDFNQENALKQWEEKAFQGHVKYWVDFDHQNGFVRSESKKTSSAIFYRIKFDISQYPYMTWKWRVGKFPEKKDAKDPKKADDFAARVYVVFLSNFFTQYRCVEYVWDETLPEGSILTSPYSDKIKHMVIQSGHSSEQWVSENQNVYDDYKKMFGDSPRMKVGAIALMTDAEGTETEAEGFFDDIQIGKQKISLEHSKS